MCWTVSSRFVRACVCQLSVRLDRSNGGSTLLCLQALRSRGRLDDKVLTSLALPNLVSLVLGGTACTERPILHAADWSGLCRLSLNGAEWVGAIDDVVQHLARTAPLTDLALAGFTDLTDSAVKAVIRQCSEIESLDLSGCRSLEGSFATVIEELGTCALRRLILSGCVNVSDQHVRTILLCKPPLQVLDLAQCVDIGGQTAQALQMGCRMLETLNLQGTNISSEGLRRALDGCPHLSSLCVHGCTKLSAEASSACLYRGLNALAVDISSEVAPAIDEHPIPQSLELHWQQTIAPPPTLTAAEGLTKLAIHNCLQANGLSEGAAAEESVQPWPPLVFSEQLLELNLSHPSIRIENINRMGKLTVLKLNSSAVELSELQSLLEGLAVLTELSVRQPDRAATNQLMVCNTNREEHDPYTLKGGVVK